MKGENKKCPENQVFYFIISSLALFIMYLLILKKI